MWNSEKSIVLSIGCVILFMVLLVLTVIFAPWLVSQFIIFSRAHLESVRVYFLMTIYIGALPAGVLLVNLYLLLGKIRNNQVFLIKNVEYLRRISWSCFVGALLSLIGMTYYIPWIFVAVAAAFMGLIVRVIRNIISEAVLLKEESEFTI